MTLRFVLVPQWQGSPSPRAMRLAEGVAALRGDLPASATSEVAVPLEAGDEQGTGISRYTSVQLVRERTAVVLQDLDGPFVVVGGDCGVSAAGSMALTLYTAHAVVLAIIHWTAERPERWDVPGWTFPALAVGALVVATLWRRFVGTGPLELGLRALTGLVLRERPRVAP